MQYNIFPYSDRAIKINSRNGHLYYLIYCVCVGGGGGI